MVCDTSSCLIYLASPKSVSLGYPFLNMRTFYGFRSLYIILFLCAYSIPNTTQAKMNLAPSSPNSLYILVLVGYLALFIKLYTSPPSA